MFVVIATLFPFRWAGSPAAQAGSLCYHLACVPTCACVNFLKFQKEYEPRYLGCHKCNKLDVEFVGSLEFSASDA
jgi:hypothetical protein